MSDDLPLWEPTPRRRRRGRVRVGLEADVTAARESDVTLSAAGVATLRTLADSIDDLDHSFLIGDPKPYARVPLTQLVNQFDDTYERVFSVAAHSSDPLARALAEFSAAEGRDAEVERTD